MSDVGDGVTTFDGILDIEHDASEPLLWRECAAYAWDAWHAIVFPTTAVAELESRRANLERFETVIRREVAVATA